MSRIPPSERRRSDPTSDPDLVRSFPFITNDAWYREYWYEREPGRLSRLIAALRRLAPKARDVVRVLIDASQVLSRRLGQALRLVVAKKRRLGSGPVNG